MRSEAESARFSVKKKKRKKLNVLQIIVRRVLCA